MLQIPLDIPNIDILKVEYLKNGDIIVTVKSTVKEICCRKCGKKIDKFHGCNSAITLRHLSILGRKTYIRICPARYECPHCKGKPTTTQRLSWYDQRSPQTKAFEEHILLALVNSTISDVSIKEDLGYEAIMGIIDRYVGSDVDWNKIERLDIIGLDEISLKKGHKDFVTIVTARIDGKTIILAVLKDRKKATVKQFLQRIPERLKKTVKAVCSDAYEGFVNAAKEVFGKKVMVVLDRFHIAKLYRNGLDSLRKEEMKRLKKELSEEEYKKLKGAMWILRKAKKDLTDEDIKVRDTLFKYSPILKIAYELCNSLTDIFEKDITKEEAKKKIKAWMKSVKKSKVTCFDTFLSTLDKWMEEITNYFVSRQNSGFVEGLNNKIKVIKRRCYGIPNPDHLFQRIYLDLEGFALYA